MSAPTHEYLSGLITELRKLPAEMGWLEFKESNSNPEDIGEYLSALSNMAALQGKANGYVIWGIKDLTHEVVGTSFKPAQTKKGNEDIENWLARLLSPRLHFQFYEVTYEGQPVVVLEIPRAQARPVQFQGVEFIRVGSYRQKLKDHPQIEKDLWRVFDTICYLHACLRYVERDPMTNSTLRARLGISEPNKAMASRIIADAVRDSLVKPEDPHQGKKYAKYVPFWA